MFLSGQPKSYFTANINKAQYISTILKLFIGSTLFTAVNAGFVCFEKDDHDYGLLTRSGLNVDTISSNLKDDCGTYYTRGDDAREAVIYKVARTNIHYLNIYLMLL